jgi:DnaJ-class molecular chaperone
VNDKDFYQILGIIRSASAQEIKEAYRKLAFQYHPDRNQGNPKANEKMKEINEAYATLSDPNKRNEYDTLKDRYGSFAYDRFRQSHSPEDIFRGSDINQIFEEFARQFGFRGSDEIFREFYGPGYRSFQFQRPGFSVRGFVFTPFGNSQGRTEGSTQQVPFPGAFGRLTKWALKMAGIQFPERGKDRKDVISLTPQEAVKGGDIQYTYRKGGKPKNLVVKIPPGTKNDQRIRLKGMGTVGKDGGQSGDLFLQVRIRLSLYQRIKGLLTSHH